MIQVGALPCWTKLFRAHAVLVGAQDSKISPRKSYAGVQRTELAICALSVYFLLLISPLIAWSVPCMVVESSPTDNGRRQPPEDSHVRRGRFSLGPLLMLTDSEANTLRSATLRKATDSELPSSDARPKVRRVGRFECEAADSSDIIKRRRVGRFDVVTVPSACTVSRTDDPSQMALAVLRHEPST